MKIETLAVYPYQFSLSFGQRRFGILVHLIDERGDQGWGDIAPLPQWSQETLEDSLGQLKSKQGKIMAIDWTAEHCLEELEELSLYPSVSFGLESALLSMLAPISACTVMVSALLMGSPQEILAQARQREAEGFTSAKLKVSALSFKEAAEVIHQLKERFDLRIDVNRAWKTAESLDFFSQFPLETFDYVEEPFQDPEDLFLFSHPLAIDESFPHHLSLEQLEELPTLKALIYKPTIQGGLLGCLPLKRWAHQRDISLILSSSFESDIGLAQIASLAHRLSLSSPIGLGTYHYMNDYLFAHPLCLSRAKLSLSSQQVNTTVFNAIYSCDSML